MKKFVLVGEEYAAAKILSILIKNQQTSIICVFTDLSKVGPLHQLTNKHNIEIHDSARLKDLSTIKRLKVIDGMWLVNILSAVIIPENILAIFSGRTFNLHTGPLPQYAGIHVHQWGIRNGET